MNRLRENAALRALAARRPPDPGRAQDRPAEAPGVAQARRGQGGPRLPYGVCQKTRHRSRGLAEAAARSLVRRGLHRPEEGALHVYYCLPCCAWHVGHSGVERDAIGKA